MSSGEKEKNLADKSKSSQKKNKNKSKSQMVVVEGNEEDDTKQIVKPVLPTAATEKSPVIAAVTNGEKKQGGKISDESITNQKESQSIDELIKQNNSLKFEKITLETKVANLTAKLKEYEENENSEGEEQEDNQEEEEFVSNMALSGFEIPVAYKKEGNDTEMMDFRLGQMPENITIVGRENATKLQPQGSGSTALVLPPATHLRIELDMCKQFRNKSKSIDETKFCITSYTITIDFCFPDISCLSNGFSLYQTSWPEPKQSSTNGVLLFPNYVSVVGQQRKVTILPNKWYRFVISLKGKDNLLSFYLDGKKLPKLEKKKEKKENEKDVDDDDDEEQEKKEKEEEEEEEKIKGGDEEDEDGELSEEEKKKRYFFPTYKRKGLLKRLKYAGEEICTECSRRCDSWDYYYNLSKDQNVCHDCFKRNRGREATKEEIEKAQSQEGADITDVKFGDQSSFSINGGGVLLFAGHNDESMPGGVKLRYVEIRSEYQDEEETEKRKNFNKSSNSRMRTEAQERKLMMAKLCIAKLTPKAYPLWHDPAFIAMFCDPYLEGSGLNGGLISQSLRIFNLVVSSMVGSGEGKSSEVLDWYICGPKNGEVENNLLETESKWFTKKDKDILNSVIEIFSSSEGLFRRFSKVADFPTVGAVIKRVHKMIIQMIEGDIILIPLSWKKEMGKHNLLAIVEKLFPNVKGNETQSNTFRLVIINTGLGQEHHPVTSHSHPKIKYKHIVLEGIPEEKMTDASWWLFFLSTGILVTNGKHLYDLLVPWLVQKPLESALEETFGDPSSDWRTPQYSESDHFKCLKHGFHYLLRRKGLSIEKAKMISFNIRRQMVSMMLKDLNVVVQHGSVTDSDTRVINIALEQLALNTVKITELGRLEFEQTSTIHKIIEEVSLILFSV